MPGSVRFFWKDGGMLLFMRLGGVIVWSSEGGEAVEGYSVNVRIRWNSKS